MSATTDRVLLGSWPTPLEAAPRLAEALGCDELWLKRDDLTGLGGGGNKVRKLEYALGEALAGGFTTVVTSGAAQSNHARITAAAANRLGLGCVLVLAGSPPSDENGDGELRGNLLLDAISGVELVWAGAALPSELSEAVDAEAARRGAFVVPYGGSSRSTIQGYADAAAELLDQLPDLDRVVVAVGSGGTMAGLVRGLDVERVVGVDTGATADPRAAVLDLLGEPTDSALPLVIDRDQVGAGYSTVTPAVRAALELVARTEGVFLDPIYTGRALAALASGSVPTSGRTVFLHSGGLPGLFGAAY